VIKIAYFTVEDIAFPCPVLRVLAPARALGPHVLVNPAVCAVDGRKYENPSALATADVVLVQRGFPRNVMDCSATVPSPSWPASIHRHELTPCTHSVWRPTSARNAKTRSIGWFTVRSAV